MKTQITKLFYLSLLLLFTTEAKSQYNMAIGVRYGVPSKGLTLIQYVANNVRGAAEFTVCNQFGGYAGTALYEVHFKNHNVNIEVANVGAYIGIGAHYGRYKGSRYYENFIDSKSINAIGLDAIAGIEWKMPHIPLLLSVDAKPFYDIFKNKDSKGNTYKQFNFLDFAVSLRYVF